MDRVSKLVALAVLVTAGTVHAGYAQLAPPAGFSGTPGAWKFAPSANQAVFGNVLHHPGALRFPVPGSSVTMPVAYRLAANAPRIAAAAIFLNPYVRVGVGIASWLGIAGIVWDAANQTWAKPNNDYPVSDGYLYKGAYWAPAGYPSPGAACSAAAVNRGAAVGSGYSGFTGVFIAPSTCRIGATDSTGQFIENWGGDSITKSASSCPAGWYVTPAGCVQNPPPKVLQPQEFEELLSPNPMPEKVPLELPPNTPLPIDPPVVNPEPGPNPQPRPLFVPTGDPVPNPQYDPNSPSGPNNLPWNQPGVRVVPSPTPLEPWRVDLQPVNRPVSGPEPMTQPDSETPPDTDKPSQEQLDFCVKNPDVLACQKLDEPAAEELPESEKDISITPDGGWGADNSACPAPKLITVQGRAIPIPFDLFCTWASGMRPIIISMAWLSAAFILLGARNES